MSIWGPVGNFLVKDSLVGLQARPTESSFGEPKR